jgi:hypothetical protein
VFLISLFKDPRQVKRSNMEISHTHLLNKALAPHHMAYQKVMLFSSFSFSSQKRP